MGTIHNIKEDKNANDIVDLIISKYNDSCIDLKLYIEHDLDTRCIKCTYHSDGLFYCLRLRYHVVLEIAYICLNSSSINLNDNPTYIFDKNKYIELEKLFHETNKSINTLNDCYESLLSADEK